jgi:hypothetical protein
MKKLLFSITVTLLVSLLFGSIFFVNFWKVFALATIIQILFFVVFNTIYGNYLQKKALEINTKYLTERSKFTKLIQCPCGDSTQEVEVSFSEDVVYECTKCKNKVKAVVVVKPVLLTDPVYTVR